MSITYHERPGVYSSYEASSIAATGTARRVVALIGSGDAEAGLYTVTSCADGCATFGTDSALGQMLQAAYQNGAGTVLVYAVQDETAESYTQAAKAVLAEKTARLCVMASAQETVQLAVLREIEAAAEQKGECIGLCAMDAVTVAELTARAKKLNSERMVLVAPPGYWMAQTQAAAGFVAAAALAGQLAKSSDPAQPLNGLELQGLSGVTAAYSDTEYDALCDAGVTVLECTGGVVSVIRALTTRTMSGGSSDRTYRELTTMLILDELLPALRTALRAKFARAKNNALTRRAIRNQVILELQTRVEREILEGYDAVEVAAAEDDRTTCVVRFTVTLVQGLNRILVTVQVQV